MPLCCASSSTGCQQSEGRGFVDILLDQFLTLTYSIGTKDFLVDEHTRGDLYTLIDTILWRIGVADVLTVEIFGDSEGGKALILVPDRIFGDEDVFNIVNEIVVTLGRFDVDHDAEDAEGLV